MSELEKKVLNDEELENANGGTVPMEPIVANIILTSTPVVVMGGIATVSGGNDPLIIDAKLPIDE